MTETKNTGLHLDLNPRRLTLRADALYQPSYEAQRFTPSGLPEEPHLALGVAWMRN